MKKLLLILAISLNYWAYSQCNFGTGSVSGNPAPFASGSAAVTVSGNNVTVVANTNMPGGIYNFNNFTVNPGVTINVVAGNGPLDIRCTGTATINGIIRSDGENGGNGSTGLFSGGFGGTSGTGGGGWGAAGGTGGTTGANQNGLDGANFGTSSGRGLGGTGTFSSSPFYGAGGGGAGYSISGANGASNDGGAGGAGGQAYGDAGLTTTMTHLGVTSNLLGGSGGGGGGHRGSFTVHGGGGGGGGGGAIGITANSIVFGASGLLSARGGNGGTSANQGGAFGGSGGGGSGGTILLQSSDITGFTAVNNANVSGGTGGLSPSGTTVSAGGNGAAGRILTLPCGAIVNTITTGTITGSQFCAGATFNVPFTSSGTFNAGNVYTAQLSNASGSFATPVNIGTLNSTANSGNISVTLPGGTPNGTGYQIRVIASNPSTTGSSSTAFAVDNTISPITINPSGTITLCVGQSITLEAQSGFTNYVWSPGNISGQTLNVNQSGTYSVTAQTSQGCQAASSTVQVIVNTEPAELIIVPSGSLNLCQGQSVTLTAEAGISDLLWSNGATTQSIIITQAGTYSATGNNSIGCPVVSDEFIVTVGNAQPGGIAVTPADTARFCPGQSVTLTAADGFFNYEWSNQQEGQSITITQEGAYIVNAINPEGCEASSLPVIVQQIDVPDANFSYSQTDGYLVEFENQSTFGNQYLWTFTSGNTSTQANPSFTFPFDGTYPVTLTVTNQCGSNSVTIDVIVEKLSVQNIDANILNFSVQPNPTNGITIIKGETKQTGVYSFNLFNMIGQKVMEESWQLNGTWRKELDLTSLPKGMYWIHLDSAKGKISRKLIKL